MDEPEVSTLAPQSLGGGRFFPEICCGSGRLSAAAQQRGLAAIGVDYQFNKFSPICRSITADLRTDGGQTSTTELLDDSLQR